MCVHQSEASNTIVKFVSTNQRWTYTSGLFPSLVQQTPYWIEKIDTS